MQIAGGGGKAVGISLFPFAFSFLLTSDCDCCLDLLATKVQQGQPSQESSRKFGIIDNRNRSSQIAISFEPSS